MTSSLKKAAVILIVGTLLFAAIYLFAQLFWPIELAIEGQRDALQRERGLLYQTDHAALAAQLRKFAYQHRWSEAPHGDEATIFWPTDPALPQSIRILQPTSVAIFDDRIMFERGGPLHHFGIVVFREGWEPEEPGDDGFPGERLLKEFHPGVWFYSDYRKLPPP